LRCNSTKTAAFNRPALARRMHYAVRSWQFLAPRPATSRLHQGGLPLAQETTVAASELAKPALAPGRHDAPEPVAKPSAWGKYLTPLLVLLLAAAVVFTITRNWVSWEGSRDEQVTDDASVRGDVTPLNTKVAGIVRT